jgi:DNA-binding MurR/RpiR family transcriptional regulator
MMISDPGKEMPMRNRSFLARVRGALPELPPAERRLGEMVSDFPGELASYSGAELAALAGVSNATVSRFVRRLGYANYEEARRDARVEQSTGSRLYMVTPGDQTPETPGGAYLATAIENLRRSFAKIEDADLDAIAEALLSARKVWVIGYRASQSFATYLQWQLTQVIENIVSIPGSGQTVGEHLASLRPDDVVIFVGLRRRVTQTETILGLVEARGARLLYLTDEGVPPRPGATWHFRCETRSPGPLFSHVAVMGLCHMLVDRTIEVAGQAGRLRLRRMEQINDSLGEL